MVNPPLISDRDVAKKICQAPIKARETMSDEDFHIWLEGFKTLLGIIVENNCSIVCFNQKLE